MEGLNCIFSIVEATELALCDLHSSNALNTLLCVGRREHTTIGLRENRLYPQTARNTLISKIRKVSIRYSIIIIYRMVEYSYSTLCQKYTESSK